MAKLVADHRASPEAPTEKIEARAAQLIAEEMTLRESRRSILAQWKAWEMFSPSRGGAFARA